MWVASAGQTDQERNMRFVQIDDQYEKHAPFVHLLAHSWSHSWWQTNTEASRQKNVTPMRAPLYTHARTSCLIPIASLCFWKSIITFLREGMSIDRFIAIIPYKLCVECKMIKNINSGRWLFRAWREDRTQPPSWGARCTIRNERTPVMKLDAILERAKRACTLTKAAGQAMGVLKVYCHDTSHLHLNTHHTHSNAKRFPGGTLRSQPYTHTCILAFNLPSLLR